MNAGGVPMFDRVLAAPNHRRDPARHLSAAGRRDGAYWYHAGFPPSAVIAGAADALVGLLAVHTTGYTGRWSNIASGVDLSFACAFLTAGVLDLALEALLGSRAARTPSDLPVDNPQLHAASTPSAEQGER